jgi:transcriptional regulator with XRE-family HTH domain
MKTTRPADQPSETDDQDRSSAAPDVGVRLRATRMRRRMTLKVVAEQAGLSESFLSQLERGRVNASIGSLQRIAAVLGTTLAEVFDPGRVGDVQLVRKDERPSLRYGVLGRKFLLTPTPTPLENLEVFVGRFDTGGSTGDEPYAHGDSDEMFVVLDGRFELQVGDETYTLDEGDCVNYRSSLPHRAVFLGEGTGEVMWIISPPSM